MNKKQAVKLNRQLMKALQREINTSRKRTKQRNAAQDKGDAWMRLYNDLAIKDMPIVGTFVKPESTFATGTEVSQHDTQATGVPLSPKKPPSLQERGDG